MGKEKAPGPDPRIGDAALRTAELGDRYLTFMQEQAGITNNWAAEDRARYRGTFMPLEDRYISEAANYNSPERRAAAVTEAVGDVRQESAIARGTRERSLTAMGVNPNSGRFAAEERRGGVSEALASAGAGNMARRQVEAMAEAKTANAINLGKGLSVNPATSMGLSMNATGAGFQGAMNGQTQMAGMLGDMDRTRMNAWQQNNSMWNGIGGAVGSLAGAFLLSSKDAKTNKRQPEMSVLDAVRDMPVEQWSYKDGMGDGGGRDHIGPYAEDFQRATGLGDGQTISIVDAIGVNMRATQELADKVDRIEAAVTGGQVKPSGPPAPRRQPPRQSQRTAPSGREMSIMGVA